MAAAELWQTVEDVTGCGKLLGRFGPLVRALNGDSTSRHVRVEQLARAEPETIQWRSKVAVPPDIDIVGSNAESHAIKHDAWLSAQAPLFRRHLVV